VRGSLERPARRHCAFLARHLVREERRRGDYIPERLTMYILLPTHNCRPTFEPHRRAAPRSPALFGGDHSDVYMACK